MVAPAVASPPGVALDLASGAGAAGTDPGVGVGDLARLETELAERAAALGARELAIRDLSSRLDAAESALGEKEAEEASLKARAEALSAQVRRTEADARAAREEAGLAKEQARAALARAESAEARTTGSEARAAAAEGRCAAAEQEAASQRRSAEQAVLALTAKAAELVAAQVSAARLVDVERDVGRLESELTVARGEVEGARSELELRSAELTRRISELEAANVKNEERVVKAYLKIKGDEKLRDKARKALAIALQLLEEGLPAELPAEKRPRPVSE
jgi:chromosome segregation ATPase